MHFLTVFLNFPRQLFFTIQAYLPLLQLLSNVISAAFFVGIFYCLWNSPVITFQNERLINLFAGMEKLPKHRVKQAWRQVQRRLKSKRESGLKLAVIEADHIFDEIVKLSGVLGDTMDERLDAVTEEQIPNLNRLRETHRLVQRIAHDPELTLEPQQAADIIKTYRSFFQEYGLVD